MSDILFKCSNCRKSLAIDDKGTGQTIQCPDCNYPITVPKAAIIFQCSSCKCDLSAPLELKGSAHDCPNCSKKLIISDPLKPKLICPKCSANLIMDIDDLMSCEEKTVQCIGCNSDLDVSLLLNPSANQHLTEKRPESKITATPQSGTKRDNADSQLHPDIPEMPRNEKLNICEKCHKPTALNSQFCMNCGVPLVSICHTEKTMSDKLTHSLLIGCFLLCTISMFSSVYIISTMPDISDIRTDLAGIRKDISAFALTSSNWNFNKTFESQLSSDILQLSKNVDDIEYILNCFRENLFDQETLPPDAEDILSQNKAKRDLRLWAKQQKMVTGYLPSTLSRQVSSLNTAMIDLQRDMGFTKKMGQPTPDRNSVLSILTNLNNAINDMKGMQKNVESLYNKVFNIKVEDIFAPPHY